MDELVERAQEISSFLDVELGYAMERLGMGFLHNHELVADDFNFCNPQTDEELLSWYRTTDTYIWELSAYHMDKGFNYTGMCKGLIDHVVAEGKQRVMCLGDGIGDLSIGMSIAGRETIYHDLSGSQTALFANARFIKYGASVRNRLSGGWSPPTFIGCGAIIALDFFEHLVNVEEWVRAVVRGLSPKGIFLAQNAFAIGDEEHGGSIPMHLVRNNRFEKDWEPLLESLGLQNLHNGWWQKP